MTSRQLFLVARQTYLTRIKSFGYWALVLAPVLIVGVIAGITFIITATQSHKTPVVGVVNQPALTTYLKKTDGFDAKVKSVAILCSSAAAQTPVHNRLVQLLSTGDHPALRQRTLATTSWFNRTDAINGRQPGCSTLRSTNSALIGD